MVKKYTVLGVYDDTGETFAHHCAASDEYAAIEQAAKDGNYSSDLVIIGAVSGHVQLLTPGADNITSVYASNYERDDNAEI